MSNQAFRRLKWLLSTVSVVMTSALIVSLEA